MEASERLRYRARSTCTMFLIFSFFTVIPSSGDLSMNVAHPTTLKISSVSPVENSPGSRSGAAVVCERIHIHGISRLHNLKKYAHSVKVKVKVIDKSSGARMPKAEVCFHRNASLRIGMCAPKQWEKLTQGSWIHSMSPYDYKLLDIRIDGPTLEILEVLVEEELLLYRVIFLVLGLVLWIVAPSLSKFVAFYYSGAMAVGVILVILMVLFQGMKLLPTGRKNSLAIVIYSSLVGVGSLFLRHLPGLLRSILVEIGISDDMYTPTASLVLVCVILAGAWLGFWVVRRLVLTEDGYVDPSVAQFVANFTRLISVVLIFQSSLDSFLATGALMSGILVSEIMRRIAISRFLGRLRKSLQTTKSPHRKSRIQESPSEDLHDASSYRLRRSEEAEFLTHRSGQYTPASRSSPAIDRTRTPLSFSLDSETYLSTFHDTPERKKFSKEEWESFTRDSTRTALEDLVSSPDFSTWAARNAERLTLAPSRDSTPERRTRWFLW